MGRQRPKKNQSSITKTNTKFKREFQRREYSYDVESHENSRIESSYNLLNNTEIAKIDEDDAKLDEDQE
jgi:hypothetical protein